MFWKKLRVLWWNHKAMFLVVAIIAALFFLTVLALSAMESFMAEQTILMLPLEGLRIIGYSLVGAFFWFWFMFKVGMPMSSGGGGKLKGSSIKVTFADVIGLTEAKREAMEVVTLIKDRTKVRKIGGKVIRGLLMIGPPGCGKTFLAKAIAHESNAPFFSISGSEFVEVFVGVGASRVRKLFQQAKAAAYVHGSAIIFIDEMDAIGQSRKFSMFGSQESDTTLNQLLVNMDGLSKDDGGDVIIIGATNADMSTLDPALLRPGRFDRHIHIHMPRLKDREDLFQHYLKKVKSEPDLNVGRLARKAVWKSPADVENIVKEAALISIRHEREAVSYKDIVEAMERIDLGLETHLELTTEERERVAYHEAGHLLVLYTQHPTDDVFKASIKTRGGALGVVYHQPREEMYTKTRDELYANVKTALAGYVAEKIKYKVTSTGVSGDFRNAMSIASSMVWHYGMSRNGFVGDYSILLNRTGAEGQISERMKDDLNKEVQDILHDAAKDVEKLLKAEWVLMDAFVKELLERQELDYDEIEAIFKLHNKERVRA